MPDSKHNLVKLMDFKERKKILRISKPKIRFLISVFASKVYCQKKIS